MGLVTKKAHECQQNGFTRTRTRTGPYDSTDMYSGSMGSVSFVRLGGRKVSLQAQWGGYGSKKPKWKDQHIMDMDVNEFVQDVVDTCGWRDSFEQITTELQR